MSEHLLRTIVVETVVSPSSGDVPDLVAIVTNELYRSVEREAAKHKFVVTKTDISRSEEIYFDDEGAYPVVVFRAIARAYQPDESSQQTIIKLNMDEAMSDWMESDDE